MHVFWIEKNATYEQGLRVSLDLTNEPTYQKQEINSIQCTHESAFSSVKEINSSTFKITSTCMNHLLVNIVPNHLACYAKGCQVDNV